MKAIMIRNIPKHIYEAIQELARRNHRSMQQQVIQLLEQFVRLKGSSPLERAGAIRDRLQGRELGDTLAELRQERAR
jgi:plasmid stability protein